MFKPKNFGLLLVSFSQHMKGSFWILKYSWTNRWLERGINDSKHDNHASFDQISVHRCFEANIVLDFEVSQMCFQKKCWCLQPACSLSCASSASFHCFHVIFCCFTFFLLENVVKSWWDLTLVPHINAMQLWNEP